MRWAASVLLCACSFAVGTVRELPTWYNDAKLGIFVHWGAYSVPAYAPLSGAMPTLVSEKNWEYMFKHDPYAEWHVNPNRRPNVRGFAARCAAAAGIIMRCKSTEAMLSNTTRGSVRPLRVHATLPLQDRIVLGAMRRQTVTRRTYGSDYAYESFVRTFKTSSQAWDERQFADVLREVGAKFLALHTHRNYVLYQRDALQIGAKYVVITTKHHDGYCLWPTKVQNPHKTNYSSERDLVGDLAEAVRARSECFWEERKP